MWSRVSLWVMQQDAAYRLDGRDGWVFYLVDGAGAPFDWKGIDYTSGIAASAPAYLDYELPPGTYVVWAARGVGDEAEDTHRAVLAVHDEPQLVLRLLPRPRPKPCPCDDPEPEDHCRLEVISVQGDKIRDERPGRITVLGKAEDCSRVKVVVQANGITLTDTVDVEQDGSWKTALHNEGIPCGAVVVVTVICEKDERCRTRRELRLECDRPKQKPTPPTRSTSTPRRGR